MGKSNRNKPCFCGSGKKYKKCCLYRGDRMSRGVAALSHGGIGLSELKAFAKSAKKEIFKSLAREVMEQFSLRYLVLDKKDLLLNLETSEKFVETLDPNEWLLVCDDEAGSIGQFEKFSEDCDERLVVGKITLVDEHFIVETPFSKDAIKLANLVKKYIPEEFLELVGTGTREKYIMSDLSDGFFAGSPLEGAEEIELEILE